MPPIFCDNRLNFGNFPDLVTQWFGIIADQSNPTSSTRPGFHAHDSLALARRNQRPFLLGMTRLPTPFFAAFLSRRYRLRMGMFGTRWKRRIPRRFSHSRFQIHNLLFQFGDSLFIMINHRLQQRPKFRRQRGQLLCCDGGMQHDNHVADFDNRAKTNFTRPLGRGVNGYRNGRQDRRQRSGLRPGRKRKPEIAASRDPGGIGSSLRRQ